MRVLATLWTISALLAGLVWADRAAAAVASVQVVTGQGPRGSPDRSARMRVEDSDGEANRLVLASDGRAIVVSDQAVPLSAGPGCSPATGGAVRCELPADALGSLAVIAGAGDDAVDARAVDLGSEVDAGEGSDEVVGSARRDRLSGGAGADRLAGGGGDDRLDGGSGSDLLAGDDGIDELVPDGDGIDRADDTIDGGPGQDRLSYAARTLPVGVDLGDADPEGSAGERDVVTTVEDVVGGAAGDRLVGGPGPNRLEGAGAGVAVTAGDVLEGGSGDDELTGTSRADGLIGGGGDDLLLAGGGRDRLQGNDGDDEIYPAVSTSRSTTLSCGSGRDTAADPSPLLRVPRDCESVAAGDVEVAILTVQRRQRGTTIRLVLRARERPYEGPCRVRARVGTATAVVRRPTRTPRRRTLVSRSASTTIVLRVDAAGNCRSGRFRPYRTLRFALDR